MVSGDQGLVLYSLKQESDLGSDLGTGPYKDSALARVWKNVISGGKPVISDIEYYGPARETAFFVGIPIFDAHNNVVAALIEQFNPEYLTRILSQETGLGTTGEVFLLGEDMLLRSSLRNFPEAPILGKQIETKIVQNLFAGTPNTRTYQDYRGVSVLTTSSFLGLRQLLGTEFDWGIIVKQDEAEVFASLVGISRQYLMFMVGVIAFAWITGLFFGRIISAGMVRLTTVADAIASGSLETSVEVSSEDEVGRLAEAIRKMQTSQRATMEKARQTDWLKTGIARLNDALRGEEDSTQLAEKAIRELCMHLDAMVGILYVMQDEGPDVGVLTMLGSYAYTRRKKMTNHFSPGEGLVGQAALERRQIVITDVPDDYIQVVSGLGQTAPRSICVTPFLFEDKIRGVVEIGTLGELDALHLDYLGQAEQVLGVAFETALGRTRLARELERSKKLGDELQVQKEELKSSNEALQQQTQSLRLSEAKLQAQQEELRLSNEELSEKNELLTRQKQEAEATRKALAEKAEELARQKQEAEATRKALADKAEELARQKQEAEAARKALAEKAEELARQKNEADATREALAEKAEELARQKQEAEATREALAEKAEELARQKQEAEATREALAEKAEELARQKQEADATREALAEKAEELAQTGNYKSEFLANMSHELRTPLNSLLLLARGFVDNREGNLSPDQIESARVIYGSGNDLLSLINEILDLSKIESGHMDLSSATVVLKDAALAVEDAFSHMAEELDLRLLVETDPDLPSSIETDAKRLQQILRNLVSNAIKFTEKGSVTVRFHKPSSSIDLNGSGLDPSQALAVSVSDTGIGISPENQKLVFEAFQQVDGGTTRKYSGTGLGLSISRELARILGGVIQLASEVGKGSTFTLYLPLVTPVAGPDMNAGQDLRDAPTPRSPETDPLPAGQASDDLDGPEAMLKGKRILIADDDMRSSFALSRLLSERGMEVVKAENGEKALKILVDGPVIDLVLMDVMMPVMDGLEAIRRIRAKKRFANLPIIVLTAKAMAGDREKCLAAGANDYQTKPIDPERLIAMMRVWLSNLDPKTGESRT